MRQHQWFQENGLGEQGFRGEGRSGRGAHRGGGRGPGRGPGPEGMFGGFGPGGFGFGPHRGDHEGPGGFAGRRGRGRRGDVRKGILAILKEGPANGYQIMEGIAERSQGLWRPSPGSVYPALAMLEDEGVIEATQVDGRKAFALTEAGMAQANEKAEELAGMFNDLADSGEGLLDVRAEVGQLAMTLTQVARGGTPEQRAQAKEVLVRARQDLHRIMAGDPVQS